MKTRIALLFILTFCASPIWAQNETDVLNMSQYFTGGTARGISLNGAYGALGGDMTSLSTNPAGIGVYRSSEFVFTPSFSINNSTSNYYKNSYEDSKNKLNISNMGLVFAYSSNREVGWVGLSLGVAYNRLVDFNRNITMRAKGINSSFLDEFVYNANQVGGNIDNLDPYYERLAYNTFAIDKSIDNPNVYISDFSDFGYGQNLQQQRIIGIKGGIGEYAFSLGANYSNTLYLGATIGVQRVSYEENKVHEETNLPTGSFMESFRFYEDYYTYGTGYNFKIGAIYRPIAPLRLGFAFHTPTYYSLDSEFDTEMTTDFRNTPPGAQAGDLKFRDKPEDLSLSEYNVTSPLKMIFSGAFQNQFGLLSMDFEYVDYSASKIRSDGDSFSDINEVIQRDYRQTFNFKVGGEIKLDEFAIRGGYGYYGSPFYSGHMNKNADTQSYSFGVGYRGESMFIDLGYIAFNTKSKYRLYSGEQFDAISDIDTKLNRFVLTVGFKF